MAFELTSPAFEPGTEIPSQYTCEGLDHSPELRWGDAPAGTKSFALIVDDPDAPDPKAPKTVWVHWVLYDLPADRADLPRQAGHAPMGSHDGLNDWKKTGWNGPCPPIGTHRYFFKLYALDTVLGDRGPITKAQLEEAMSGHILGQAETMGTYQKQRRG